MRVYKWFYNNLEKKLNFFVTKVIRNTLVNRTHYYCLSRPYLGKLEHTYVLISS
jgi:hypothetical protein